MWIAGASETDIAALGDLNEAVTRGDVPFTPNGLAEAVEGADLVLSPYLDASREAADRLLSNISKRGAQPSVGETA